MWCVVAGIAAGFSAGALLNPSSGVKDPNNLVQVLYIELGVAAALFLAVVIYFPRLPPSFPSDYARRTAEIQGNVPSFGSGGIAPYSVEGMQTSSLKGWPGLVLCFSTRSFVCLSLAGGLTNAVSSWWVLGWQFAKHSDSVCENESGITWL